MFVRLIARYLEKGWIMTNCYQNVWGEDLPLPLEMTKVVQPSFSPKVSKSQGVLREDTRMFFVKWVASPAKRRIVVLENSWWHASLGWHSPSPPPKWSSASWEKKKQFLESSTCWISLIEETSKGVKYPKRNDSSKKNMFYIHILIRIYIESCACQVSTTSDNQPKHYLVLFFCNMGQHKARFLWSPWPPQRCQASSTLSLAAHPPTLEVWPVCHDRDVDPRKCCQLAMLIPVTWPTKLQLLRLPSKKNK